MKSILENEQFQKAVDLIKEKTGISVSIDEHDGHVLVDNLTTIERLMGYESLIGICKEGGFLLDEGNDALSFKIPEGYYFPF
jgi:hypothetical protein